MDAVYGRTASRFIQAYRKYLYAPFGDRKLVGVYSPGRNTRKEINNRG